MEIARWLEKQPEVKAVRYIGLESHPQHELAKRQMKGFGSMISFELEGGMEAGRRLMDGVRVATLAVSLGGVETLIEHPASMTHASISPEDRRLAGYSDGLVRYSVGIEDVEDLIADLRQALDAASAQLPQRACNNETSTVVEEAQPGVVMRQSDEAGTTLGLYTQEDGDDTQAVQGEFLAALGMKSGAIQ